MRRFLFTTASLISLLLLVATVVVWVRSYWVADFFESHFDRYADGLGGRDEFWIVSDQDQFSFESNQWWNDGWQYVRIFKHTNGRLDRRFGHGAPGKSGTWTYQGWHGFGLRHTVIGDLSHGSPRNKGIKWFFTVRYWAVCVLLAAMPVLSLFSYLRRRRIRHQGSCPACGYNLTGNTSGTCPECGTPVEGKAKVST